MGAARGQGEAGEDHEDADPGPGLHPPVARGDPGQRGRVVWALEDGQPRPRVVDTGRVLAGGGGGRAHRVCCGVWRTGPARGLAPDWLKRADLARQTRPRRAGVVAPSLTGI